MNTIPQYPSAKQISRLLNYKMALGEKRYRGALALLGYDSDVLDMRNTQRLIDILKIVIEGRWST